MNYKLPLGAANVAKEAYQQKKGAFGSECWMKLLNY
jgi:hypothetical protein